MGLVFVFLAVLGPACFEPTCKNPKRGSPSGSSGAKEGILVQCNVVRHCPSGKGADRLPPAVDPQIIDTGSNFKNATECEKKTEVNGLASNCPFEVSPQIICLDPPGSDGCNAGTGDGSTVILVGAASSGDYRGDPDGEGGASGLGDEAGGHGGHLTPLPRSSQNRKFVHGLDTLVCLR
ncbi:hypothetical protein [Polyangium sp. 6x1]|uniref:hypothetical protein n=1 Tax=Polyangium sp. 6x1 TaxID=3042689 RepID=UPI002482E325|nr:hypothetical protein [Polyangium sp. 6x1]MDI1450643.1 hypothetical protein [Polyangium sp. 6x1]